MSTEETTIFENGDIKVTNLRAVFGAKTYSVSNISAVEEDTKAPSNLFPAILCFIGIILLLYFIVSLFNMPSYSATTNTGIKWMNLLWAIVLLAVGTLMIRSAKTSYIVKISTSSGEVKAFETKDGALIGQIIESLNTAIIQKG